VRFAAYWAPPAASALWQAAARWLGRDAERGATFAAPDARHAEITADAARYGFHATLKAPIALADGATEADMVDVLHRVARRVTPFTTAPWVLADLGGFLALIPDPAIQAGRPRALHALADACVLALEPLRRPASAEEVARRRPERFDARERDLFDAFGYPHVLDRFQAHLTLTCRLEPPEREAVAARLRAHLAPLPAEPWAFHEIALFVEPRPGAPFRLTRRIPLGGQ
jgi:hypothetical protein